MEKPMAKEYIAVTSTMVTIRLRMIAMGKSGFGNSNPERGGRTRSAKNRDQFVIWIHSCNSCCWQKPIFGTPFKLTK